MKVTKGKVQESVLYFAKQYGFEDNYKALFSNYNGLDSTVKMIIYEMFLNGFNSYHCSDEDYVQYRILLEYCTELRKVGWVDFK